MTHRDAPALRLYVACLASYNAGKLHGAWIDVEDAEQMHAEIRDMLDASPIPNAEEWAVHDHEGFTPYNPGEYPNVDDLAEIARNVDEWGPAFLHYLADVGGPVDVAAGQFEDAYCGEWESGADYAAEYVESIGAADGFGWLSNYLDFDKMWNDWTGDHWKSGPYIFRSV